MNKKVVISLYFIVILFLLVVSARIFLLKYFDYLTIKSKIDKTVSKIYSLEKENESLKFQLKKAYNLSEIEKKARYNLQMVKDNEVIVNIITDENTKGGISND